MTPRLLKANEIECRIGSINEKGATLLLYKDARVDMALLDETFGVGGWQRKHYELKNHIYASVGIKIEDEWVWKDDVGTESNTEATKGESSDSFKRACFNWGIGRELYTAPFIWISGIHYSAYINKSGKPATYDKFSVIDIGYDENKEINSLVIRNEKTGRTVFTLGIAEAADGIPEVLAKAKVTINTELEKQGYELASAKKSKIKAILEKDTIDTLNDADLVMDALDNERGETA